MQLILIKELRFLNNSTKISRIIGIVIKNISLLKLFIVAECLKQ